MKHTNVNTVEMIDKIVEYQKTNNSVLLGELCNDFEDIIGWVVEKYGNKNIPQEDMTQECVISLIKAIRKFDPEKAGKISNWAIIYMKNDLFNYIADNMKTIKMHTTKKQRKAFYNVKKLARKYSDSENSILSFDVAKKIADELDIDVSTVEEMYYRLSNSDVYLDKPLTIGNEESGIDNLYELFCIDYNHPSAIVEENDYYDYNKNILNKAFDNLTDKQKDIISERWLNEDRTTLVNLGIKYNRTAEAIRQAEEKALSSMKNYFDKA